MANVVGYRKTMDVITGMGHTADFNQGLEDVQVEVDATTVQERIDTMLESLTPRQRQVMELLLKGYTRKEVAAMLEPPVSIQSIHQIFIRIKRSVGNGNRKA